MKTTEGSELPDSMLLSGIRPLKLGMRRPGSAPHGSPETQTYSSLAPVCSSSSSSHLASCGDSFPCLLASMHKKSDFPGENTSLLETRASRIIKSRIVKSGNPKLPSGPLGVIVRSFSVQLLVPNYPKNWDAPCHGH